MNYKCEFNGTDNTCPGSSSKSENIKVDSIHRDNPGGDWLRNERAYAKEKFDKSGNAHGGSVTATFEGRLPVKMLANLPGKNNEHTNTNILHDYKAEPIRESIKNEGVKEAVMVWVGFDGTSVIAEGNHRVALANEFGQKDIPVDIRYFAGGELAESDFKLTKFEEETPQKYKDMENIMSEPLPTKSEPASIPVVDEDVLTKYKEKLGRKKRLATLKAKYGLKTELEFNESYLSEVSDFMKLNYNSTIWRYIV